MEPTEGEDTLTCSGAWQTYGHAKVLLATDCAPHLLAPGSASMK